jgi:hypothetical protein
MSSRRAEPSRTRRCRIGALVISAALLSVASDPALAAEIEGVVFAERIRVDDHTLLLNNVGLLRYKILFKGYVAALYLGEGANPREALADVPKRLEIEYFWAIEGSAFAKAGEEALAQNVPAETLQSLRQGLDRINGLYEDVKPGDRYSLTYLPAVGTELARNGKLLGVIEGADFAAAYFSIWLGPRPVSEALKEKLLAAR